MSLCLQTLCKGVRMAPSDTDRLHILEAVKDVGQDMLQGMPQLETQWLVATLWNRQATQHRTECAGSARADDLPCRGCSHIKFGRPAQSVQLMKAALQVQGLVQGWCSTTRGLPASGCSAMA